MLVDFQKEVVAKVPDDEKTVLHSNLYYYDVTGSMNSLHDLDSLATVNPKNPVYRRLDYTILNPTIDLDLDREYSFDEIFTLVQEGVITVLDNHLSSERSQTQENDDCVYLVPDDPYWIGNESRSSRSVVFFFRSIFAQQVGHYSQTILSVCKRTMCRFRFGPGEKQSDERFIAYGKALTRNYGWNDWLLP